MFSGSSTQKEIIYRDPGFLAVVWFGSSFSAVSSTDETHRRLRKRDKLLTVGGGGDGRGAESYDRKKAWYSINHSILCGATYTDLSLLITEYLIRYGSLFCPSLFIFFLTFTCMVTLCYFYWALHVKQMHLDVFCDNIQDITSATSGCYTPLCQRFRSRPSSIQLGEYQMDISFIVIINILAMLNHKQF
jgi:hypothetical protein